MVAPPVEPIRLLHGDADQRTLRFFQTWVFGLWWLMVAFDPLPGLAAVPRGYYDAVGILRLLPDAPHDWLLGSGGLVALKATLLLLCGLCLWPRAFRAAALPTVLMLVVYQSLVRGFGHINHAEIIPLIAAITLAVFAVLPQRRPSADYNPWAIPLITVALLASLCYSMIGFHRLFSSVSVFTGDSILNYVVSRSLRTSYFDFNLGAAAVSSWPLALLLRIGFPLVTLVEALAPLVLVSRWFRVVFLASMVPFHLMTLLLMEVSFLENLLLYIFFIDVSRWLGGTSALTTAARPVAQPYAPRPVRPVP